METCPNCGKQVPANSKLCPNCGAQLAASAPLPVIGVPPTVEGEILWTGSRKGDITVGIILGIVAPAIIPAALTAIAVFGLNGFGSGVALLGGLGQLFLPFVAAFLLRRKYRVAGDAMVKTLLALIALGILALLGMFALCLTGALKI